MIGKGYGKILRASFPSSISYLHKSEKNGKNNKISFDFCSKLSFFKVDTSKTARELCPQNFTENYWKMGLLDLEEFFSLG